jgi:hypothetical protein
LLRLGNRIGWLIAPALLIAMISLKPPTPTYLMGDFRAFYCAGSVIAHGANPYLNEPLRACEVAAGPPAEPSGMRSVTLPAPLPPYALLLFVPLSALPFAWAAAFFELLIVAAMTAATVLYARVTAVPALWLYLAFAAITACVTYFVGQPVPFVLLAFAGAALALRQQRWNIAAACMLVTTIEPHLALPAIAALLIAMPRTRIPLAVGACLLASAGIAAVGSRAAVMYVGQVIPAHALANAYEWQYSLTSVLTSFGFAAVPAVHIGELMYALMLVAGVVVALRLWRASGDAAALVIVPPAFAVFGGVHVHSQQLIVALPAMLYVFARCPRVRTLAATGITFAMIPWNIMSSAPMAGCFPILVGAFAAATMGRRRGLQLTAISAGIALSLIVCALIGLGPADAHFTVTASAPGAIAETSWGPFSQQMLSKTSVLMDWLRVPTIAGLALGLYAMTNAAFAGSEDAARNRLKATVAVRS